MAEVHHDPEGSKFFAESKGEEAHLIYRLLDGGILDLTHTYVPPSLRGGGLAGRIVKRALDYAREKGYRVIPSCWYAEAFIQRHPEYQDLLV
ncbi:MAG TPA: N-acetyltransferase [Sediminispirochaeta sp.]|nr:N-acetyltransferase [Sediminispirochaeta sp.]